jgi:hypothetical protein
MRSKANMLFLSVGFGVFMSIGVLLVKHNTGWRRTLLAASLGACAGLVLYFMQRQRKRD